MFDIARRPRGPDAVAPQAGEAVRVFEAPPLPYPLRLFAASAGETLYFYAEIARNNLRLLRVQEDSLTGMEQRRFRQHHAGLEVIGGEIIQHVKNGILQEIEGEYFTVGSAGPAARAERRAGRRLFPPVTGRS